MPLKEVGCECMDRDQWQTLSEHNAERLASIKGR